MRIYLVFIFGVFINSNLSAMQSAFGRLASIAGVAMRSAHSAPPRRGLYTLEKCGGLFDAFRQDKKYLSPLFGAIGHETYWMANMVKFGNPHHATIKVAQQLFHMRKDGAIHPTVMPSMVAWSLDPELIADLIVGLEHDWLLDSAYRSELVGRWGKRYQSKKAVLQPKGAPHSLEPKRMRHFLGLLATSAREGKEEMYLPHVIYQVLLSYLYAKSSDPREMREYIRRLNEFGDYADESVFNVRCLVSCEDLPLYQEQRVLLPTEFEKMVLAFFLGTKRSFPAQVPTYIHSYKGAPSVRTCVEESLRDVMNILIFKEGDFDLSLLPSTVPLKVRAFYEQYVGRYYSEEAAQAWFELLSELPDISYREQGTHEVISDMSNVLKALNYLCGMQAKTYEELGLLLSRAGRSVEMREHYYSEIVEVKIDSMGGRLRVARRSCHFFMQKQESPADRASWVIEKCKVDHRNMLLAALVQMYKPLYKKYEEAVPVGGVPAIFHHLLFSHKIDEELRNDLAPYAHKPHVREVLKNMPV